MKFYLVSVQEILPRFTPSFTGAEVDGKGFSFWPVDQKTWLVAIDGRIEGATQGATFEEIQESRAKELGWQP